MCPPWYQRTKDDTCAPGNEIDEIVIAGKCTSQMLLETFYCMTTSDKDATNRSDVIGCCLFTDLIGSYYPLPCNITRLNDCTCGGLNREGQLCGRCIKGFAPPVYSYVLNCVNSTDYHLNWLKYIGVAFGPLFCFAF